jgi:hypothetical protein
MTRMGRMLTLLRTAVLLFAGSAHAPSVDKIIKLKIPFESTVGNKSFPAGSYSLVHTPPGYVILGTHDHIPSQWQSVDQYRPTQHQQHRNLKLDFYLVDGRHVLGCVWQEDELYGDEIFRPKDESSRLAKHKAEPAQVAAGGTQP